MLLAIDTQTKVIAFERVSSSSPDTIKAGQCEPVTVEFWNGTQVTLAEGTTVKIGIKADKDSSELVASATLTRTSGTQKWQGNLDLDTVEAAALAEGTRIYLAVQWTESGCTQESDDAALTCSKLLWAADDPAPTNANAALRAAFFSAYFTSDDDSVTFAVDEETGIIDFSASGGGISVPIAITDVTGLQAALAAKQAAATYTAGYVTMTIGANTVKFPAELVS